jgi:phage tail-like protein
MSIGIYAPYIDYFPSAAKEDPEWQDFSDLLDALDADIRDSITRMGDFYDVEKCPDYLLDKFAYFVGAPVLKSDSDRTKRIKILNAVRYHRAKGTLANIEEIVEQITGFTPEFTTFGSTYSAFFVWESLGNLSPAPNNFAKWSSYNNFSSGGAMWGAVSGSGVMERFIVYMDIKVPNASSFIVNRVAQMVEYFGAAYMRWYIGYSSPGWVNYRQVN